MPRLAPILMLWGACAAAQTVQGTVVDAATGRGIAGAEGELLQGDQAVYSATADDSGRFRIEAVKEGTYRAIYSADRYFDPGPRPATFLVGPGGSALRIEGRLIPTQRLSGRVIDGRGDAVANAEVELTTGRVLFRAQTDSRGRFELDSVIPGAPDYALAAAPPPGWKPPVPDPDTKQDRGWARTFYPGVAFREMAAAIALDPGGDLLDLEIKLLAVPLHALRGVLLNPDGTPAPKVGIGLWEPGPRRNAAYHAESKADGAFEFPAVVDGDWQLSTEFESGGVELRASEWIAVKGRNLAGVKLRLAPPFTVSGRVIMEGRQGMPAPSPPEVILMKQHAGQMVFDGIPPPPARPAPDGRFRFENLYPGTYQIASGPPPPLFYLDAQRLGDLPTEGAVELSAGSPELTIVYKSDGGTVRGTVEKCGAGRVWLVQEANPGWRIFTGACDASGRYEIPAVRPGEYYAAALPADQMMWGNLDAAFQQTASRVTVRAGEATGMELKLSR